MQSDASNFFTKFLLLGVGYLALAATTHAADYTWGGADNIWTDTTTAGWNGGPPVANDTALINIGMVTTTANNQQNGVALTIGAGGVLNAPNYLYFNTTGSLSLNSGTINVRAADGAGWRSGSLSPTVTANSGSSFINGSGGLRLEGDTTFTGDGDLTISLGLHDYTDGYGYFPATSITKEGVGTLTLSGANTYTGNTTIGAGTLLVNGSLGSGAVTVSGGTLGGTGTVGGEVTMNSGGTLRAGTAANLGTLRLSGTLNLNGGSTNLMRINKTGATLTADKIQMTGASGIAYAGVLTVVSNANSAAFAIGDKFTLFAKTAGSFSGSFYQINLPALGTGMIWDTSSLTVDGSIRVVNPNSTLPPAMNPPEGVFSGAQSVSIFCETPGATIYYTTDGTVPTNTSAVYAAPIAVSVNTNMTIRAYATSSGLSESPVTSESYKTLDALPTSTYLLDALQVGREFEGVGAVSAGASSRLLIDYPEPQRSQILDYLFKPDYGATLQHLKVEIGGGVNSTDGTEPTHQRTATDANYNRGYEWWLMKQAKARNPGVYLDCLAWGAPGWIGGGNYHSQDMCDYIANFIEGAQTHHGLTIDFAGTRNETPSDTAWIKQLRATLDARGLQNVQLVAGDGFGSWAWDIVTSMNSDVDLYNSVARVGAHYPSYFADSSSAAAQTCGKPIWASEDWSRSGDWPGAVGLAKIINRNYIADKLTKTQVWCPINSYYDCLPFAKTGLMRAVQPWSGYYEVSPAIWAMAHTTQFAAPGWHYLDGDAPALLPSGGSMVTLVSTNHSDYSIVVETSDATAAQTIGFQLTNGLSTAALHVWQTTQTNQFVEVGQITPLNGYFLHTFEPGAIYTLTTTTGQSKGSAATPPPSTTFPVPFEDNFESYDTGATPKYFSDVVGTFETATRADGQGQCLRQVSPERGIEWNASPQWQPYTILGDGTLTDYDVTADVLVEANGGLVFIMGRVGKIALSAAPASGYWLALNNANSQWELHAGASLLASGPATFPANTWHNLRLVMQGTSISCYVDQVLVTNITDSTYGSGRAGLGCGGWYGAEFDSFAVGRLHGNSRTFDLAQLATASASSVWQNDPTYGAGMANDGDPGTRWNTDFPTLPTEWLELDFPTPVSFNSVAISQFENRISGYQIQHWDGSSWIVDFNGGTIGAYATNTFPTVTASKVRLVLTDFTSTPSIYAFNVYHVPDYDAWSGSAALAGGPDGDDDHDGLSNFDEYAFGLDPKDSASVRPVMMTALKDSGTLSYTRRKRSLTGLTYSVWTSTDLKHWTEDTSASQTATAIPGTDNESVEVLVSPDRLNDDRLFVRLEAR